MYLERNYIAITFVAVLGRLDSTCCTGTDHATFRLGSGKGIVYGNLKCEVT